MKNDEVMLQYMLICLTCRFEFDQPALQGYRGSIGKKKTPFLKIKVSLPCSQTSSTESFFELDG